MRKAQQNVLFYTANTPLVGRKKKEGEKERRAGETGQLQGWVVVWKMWICPKTVLCGDRASGCDDFFCLILHKRARVPVFWPGSGIAPLREINPFLQWSWALCSATSLMPSALFASP